MTAVGTTAVAVPHTPTADVEELQQPRFLGSRRRSRVLSLTIRCAVPVLLVAVWQLASSRGWLDPDVLAPPSAVLTAAEELWRSDSSPTSWPRPGVAPVSGSRSAS